MAFVNERISEEDRLRFNLDSIKRPTLYLQSIEPYAWTIDKDRRIFLILTKGGSEDEQNAEYFAMGWDGKVIHVKLRNESVGLFKDHVTTTWSLEHAGIPPDLQAFRAEILSALKEALVAYKVRGGRVPVASHEAKFTF